MGSCGAVVRLCSDCCGVAWTRKGGCPDRGRREVSHYVWQQKQHRKPNMPYLFCQRTAAGRDVEVGSFLGDSRVKEAPL